jgi:predicted RNA binding protein YcfA (HicA-like mRNA interferase family)
VRLPRDLSGDELVRALGRVGYVVTRQSGSHQRLTTITGGEHHLTVPRHRALRAGTVAGILADVAEHLGIERNELLARLFG